MNDTDEHILAAYEIIERNGEQRDSATVTIEEFSEAIGDIFEHARRHLEALAFYGYLRPHLDLFKATPEGYEARDAIETEEARS